MIRACLAGSDHPVAQATLAAMDVLPWGANPVGARMTEEAAAICAVLTLLDPAGPIPSPDQRLGLLYQRPNSYYPLHIHDADETYVIVAGRALWTAGEDTRDRGAGEAIHHPSRMPHAFRTGPEGRAAQEESFRRHIRLAKDLDKTLVIHDRDAHAEVLRILEDEGTPQRWVMHCFSGDAAFARACLERGAHLSFAGTVTFKNAEDLRGAVAVCPADRMLVETDAPYLTPHPHRGRTNASYLVPLTMRVLAEIRAEPLLELCATVNSTTERVFGGAW